MTYILLFVVLFFGKSTVYVRNKGRGKWDWQMKGTPPNTKQSLNVLGNTSLLRSIPKKGFVGIKLNLFQIPDIKLDIMKASHVPRWDTTFFLFNTCKGDIFFFHKKIGILTACLRKSFRIIYSFSNNLEILLRLTLCVTVICYTKCSALHHSLIVRLDLCQFK